MKPSVFRHRDGIQLSYEHSHPVYDAHIYPRQSSNGSTVIIYGTDDGIRVVWYAGKKFKKPSQPTPKVNGNAKEDAMVIDLDDDEPENNKPDNQPLDFESEQEEVDPSEPYAHVLRSLNIPLGAAALKIAQPAMPANFSEIPDDSYPSLYKSTILIAAACTDMSIRLITLPLTPPAQELDVSKSGVNIVKLFGRGFHQDLISTIAISHTIDTAEASQIPEDSRSRSRNRSQPTTTGNVQSWAIMVASVSSTGSGLLLIHQVPFTGDGRLSSDSSNFAPIGRQFLRTSVLSANMSFNPSWYSSPRHSNLLISFPDAGCVKVYQVHPQQVISKTRGASTATTDSASSTRSSPNVGLHGGRFLITLLSEFAGQENATLNPRRKRILDTRWIIGGRAILALMEHGEWGVWDLEAVGPSNSSANQNLIKGRGNISGIQGGASMRFAMRGSLVQSSDAQKALPNQNPSAKSLAPATPHTRKVRAEGLFQGSSGQANRITSGPSKGCIAVASSSSSKNDESIVMIYGEDSIYIPSVQAYWKSETTGRGSFDTYTSGRAIRLPSLRTGGERIQNVNLVPHILAHQIDSQLGSSKAPPNFIVSTDTRIILFVAPLSESSEDDSVATTTNPFAMNKNVDQALLHQGELDIDGMDRILDGMNGTSKPNPLFGKSVGFQNDDVDMTSPTPAKQPRLQSGASKVTNAPRRMFS